MPSDAEVMKCAKQKAPKVAGTRSHSSPLVLPYQRTQPFAFVFCVCVLCAYYALLNSCLAVTSGGSDA